MASTSSSLGRTEPQHKQGITQPVMAVVANGMAELLQQGGCHSQTALQALLKVSPGLLLATQAETLLWQHCMDELIQSLC